MSSRGGSGGGGEGEHPQASSLASLLIRALTVLEHSPPSRPHLLLITSSLHIQPQSGLGLQHRNLQGTHTSGPPQGPCEEQRGGHLIRRLSSISSQQWQSTKQSASFFWAQRPVAHLCTPAVWSSLQKEKDFDSPGMQSWLQSYWPCGPEHIS